MALDADRYEYLCEMVKGGDARQLHYACEQLIRYWKDVPVEPLLALKEQFHRLDMEDREAHLDEVLISIAEKRPEPFTAVATEPGSPLWRPAVEVLSMEGDPAYLDLFISLLPLCPKKDLQYLVRAIGSYRGPKAVAAVGPHLTSEAEGVFFEVLLALKRDGGAEAFRFLKEGSETKRREGSPMSTILDAVLSEMGGKKG